MTDDRESGAPNSAQTSRISGPGWPCSFSPRRPRSRTSCSIIWRIRPFSPAGSCLAKPMNRAGYFLQRSEDLLVGPFIAGLVRNREDYGFIDARLVHPPENLHRIGVRSPRIGEIVGVPGVNVTVDHRNFTVLRGRRGARPVRRRLSKTPCAWSCASIWMLHFTLTRSWATGPSS